MSFDFAQDKPALQNVRRRPAGCPSATLKARGVPYKGHDKRPKRVSLRAMRGKRTKDGKGKRKTRRKRKTRV